ncbi:unnamed protein product [Prorocentrum cordatum]|uniref:Major facilitator superfamily (MFS) profile domain-containing protein n=1 Tax=Prorocentrum cordatum TaxID=2364126 RepID=A0ABN9XZZ2_9DINO|nr:unnamed protein product [Polarella glacialis]
MTAAGGELDAAEVQPMSRQQRQILARVTVLYALTCLVYRGSLSAALPEILSDFGATRAQAGKVLSLAALTYAFVKPAASALSDGRAPWRFLQAGVLSPGLCFLLMALAPSWWVLQLLVVLLHVAQGPSWPGVAGLLCSWFPPMQRGLPYSLVSSQINLVGSVVPMVVAGLAHCLGDWRGAFAALGGSNVVAALCLAQGLTQPPEPELDELCRSRQASLGLCGSRQASSEVCRSRQVSRQLSVESALASGPEVRFARLVQRLRRLKPHELRSGMVASCFLIASASLMLYIFRFGVEFWMSIYLEDTLGKDDGVRMFMFFIFWWQIGGFVGTLSTGPLTDRLGGERLPVASAAGVAMLAVVLGWHTCSAAALAGLGLFAGCACFGNRVLLMLAIRQAVPPKWGGRAEALNFLFAEFGGVLAGWPLITMLERLGGMRYFKAVLAATAAAQSAFMLLAWFAGPAASGSVEKPQGPRSWLASFRRAARVKPPRLVQVSSSENSQEM